MWSYQQKKKIVTLRDKQDKQGSIVAEDKPCLKTQLILYSCVFLNAAIDLVFCSAYKGGQRSK